MPTTPELKIGSPELEFPFPQWSAINTQERFKTSPPIKTLELLNELIIDVKDTKKTDSFSYDWVTHNMVSWRGNVNMLPKEDIDPNLYWSSLLKLSETALSTPDQTPFPTQKRILGIVRGKIGITLRKMIRENILQEDDDVLKLRLEKVFDLLVQIEADSVLNCSGLTFLKPLAPEFLTVLKEKLKEPENKKNLGIYAYLLEPMIKGNPELKRVYAHITLQFLLDNDLCSEIGINPNLNTAIMKLEQKEIEITKEILDNAQILWTYQTMYEEPKKADFIIVSGHELRLVKKAVQLVNDGYAPYLVVSGGFRYGKIRGFESEDNNKTEAAVFRQAAIEQGVPENKIILLDKPKNMGQVLEDTKKIFTDMKKPAKKGIFVFEPDALRRAKASLDKQWPEISSIVTSIDTTMEKYANNELPMPELIKQITANMRKIIEYPARGFQTKQDIPQEIEEAYNNLLKAGVLDS